MKDKSSIKKEWYEQVEALEKWAVGKTVEEVLNMPTTQKDENHTVSADKDLMTGCTIGVTAFQQALDKDGKVVFTQTDEAQNAVKFTMAGVLDGEAVAVATKGEKKDEYGMKKVSSIGKEWFEQNQAYDDWTVGKTGKEIADMKVTTNEGGKTVTADKDLMTGCTIGVDSLQKVTTTAIEAATKLN